MKRSASGSSTDASYSGTGADALRFLRGIRLRTRAMLLLIVAVAIVGIVLGGNTASAQSTEVDPAEGSYSIADRGNQSEIYGMGGWVQPSLYAGLAQSSPSVFYASKYMTWYRFFGVTDLPAPEGEMSLMAQIPGVITGFFGLLILSIASAGALLVGLALTLANSISLVDKVLYFIDYMFYTVGGKLLGLDGQPSTFLTMIILGSLLAAAFSVLVPKLKPGSSSNGLKTVATTLLAVVVLGMISVQATKNHNDPSVSGSGTADIASNGVGIGDTIEDSVSREKYASDPDSWALGSPGWLVSTAMNLTNELGGVFTGVIDGITHSLTRTGEQGAGSACDRYISGMHAVYKTSGAGREMAGKSNIMIAYDRLISQLYFTNYRLAAVGDSVGAENSWCRMAENQSGSPVGDQVMIARTAGLYGELIGTGGLGNFTGNAKSDPYAISMSAVNLTGGSAKYTVGQSSGVLVDQDGLWKTNRNGEPRDAAEVAGSIFGPRYASGRIDDKVGGFSGSRLAMMYFSGCIWTGREVDGEALRGTLNSEWNGVGVGTNVGDFDQETPLEEVDNICGLDGWEGAASQPGYSKTGTMDSTIFSEGIRPNNEPDNFVSHWNFMDKEAFASVSVPFFGTYSLGDGSVALQQFDGASEAKSVYLKTIGGDSSDVIPLTASALVLVMMIIRYFGPIVVGSILAQGIAVLILLVAILSPLLLMIPGAKPSIIFKTLSKTFTAAIVVSSVIAIIFSLTFGLVALFVDLFALQVDIALVRSILVGVAAAIALMVMVKGISYLLKMDISDPKIALAAGIAAGSPVMQKMGWDVVTPVDSAYWKKPVQEEQTREITTDADRVMGGSEHADTGLEDLVVTDKVEEKAHQRKDRNLSRPGEGKLATAADNAMVVSPLLPGAGQVAASAIMLADKANYAYRTVRNAGYNAYDSAMEFKDSTVEKVSNSKAGQTMLTATEAAPGVFRDLVDNVTTGKSRAGFTEAEGEQNALLASLAPDAPRIDQDVTYRGLISRGGDPALGTSASAEGLSVVEVHELTQSNLELAEEIRSARDAFEENPIGSHAAMAALAVDDVQDATAGARGLGGSAGLVHMAEGAETSPATGPDIMVGETPSWDMEARVAERTTVERDRVGEARNETSIQDDVHTGGSRAQRQQDADHKAYRRALNGE